MERIPPRVWRLPDRLTPTRARLTIGLSVTALVLAVLGILFNDGLERVAYAAMVVSAGLGNLAWGIGSLLPEERGGKAARVATLPLGILMFLAIPGWLVLVATGRA